MKVTFFQLARFAMVGTFNTALDAAVYIALTRSIPFFADHYLTAAAIAFFIAALNSFFWNKKWTFKDDVEYSHSQLIRFYMVSATALFLNQILLWVFVSGGVYDIAAKLMASVLAGIVNFLLQKYKIFPIVQLSENEYTEEDEDTQREHTQHV